MQCEEIREQFADYLNDSSQEPMRSEVSQHLGTCESCRTEIEELKTTWKLLGAIPPMQPASDLRTRFDAMLDVYRQGLDHGHVRKRRPSPSSWFGSWRPQRLALQFGLAFGLLIFGIVIGRFVRPAANPTSNTEITELRSELAQTRQMVALSLMQQQSASERLKGVNWSYQLQQPGREVLSALLDTLMHDPNVNVRLATVDALRQFGDQSVVRRGVVEAMSRQESPMVQIALIDLAVDLKEKESISALRQLTEDQNINETVRQRAQKGLAELE